MYIGEKIRELRKENHFTGEQLAKMLGVSAPAISKWETGSSYPDIMLLAPLARALSTTIDELLCFEDVSHDKIDEIVEIVTQCCKEKGYREGMKLALEYIYKYPKVDMLKFQLITLSNHMIYTMDEDYNEEEYEKFQDKLIFVYEELLQSANMQIKISAIMGLATIYMQKQLFDKVEELLKMLPESELVDGNEMLPVLYLCKNDYEQAGAYAQKNILRDSQYALNNIMNLISIAKRNKDYDIALIYGKKYYELEHLLEKEAKVGANLLADIYLKIGNLAEGKKYFLLYVEDLLKIKDTFDENVFTNYIIDSMAMVPDKRETLIRCAIKSIEMDERYNGIREDVECQKSLQKLQESL